MPKILHFGGPRTGATIRAFIATPIAGGSVLAAYTYGLFSSASKLAEAGIDYDLELYIENCHVDDGRNRLVRDFLETDCTDLVFIDADLRWDAKDLVKLLKHDKDVVAGVYPLKHDETSYPIRHLPGEVRIEDGLIEVDGVPTGFLKISREVLELLSKGAKVFPCKDDVKGRTMVPIIFERTHDNNTRWGGDYTFCKKWREIGGKIYLDPDMMFEHYGERNWRGNYLHHLNKSLGVMPFLDTVEKGEETQDTMIDVVERWGNPTYSASPELAYVSIKLAREANGPILECGSGLTTLLMASVTDQTIYTLEHDPIWATHIQKELDRYGIKNVKLIYTDIKSFGDYSWYNVTGLPVFDLIMCDGPPRDIYGFRKGVFDVKTTDEAKIIYDDYNADLEGCEYQVYGASRLFAIITKWENNVKLTKIGE